jgi:hypothetical protein
MSDDYINMHKRIAMGQPGAETHLKKGGKVKKYANGGSVMAEKGVANLPARTSAAPPLPKPGGKIATLKKGGPAKKGIGLTIAVGIPMRKAAGRGR